MSSPIAGHAAISARKYARGSIVHAGPPNRTGRLAWDGTAWTQQLPTTSPPGTTLPAMSYDEARSQLVLFGGFTGSSVVNNTWVWGAPAPTSCPTITSISPSSGNQGETISNFTVNGTGFQSGAILSFSGDAGVFVNSRSRWMH